MKLSKKILFTILSTAMLSSAVVHAESTAENIDVTPTDQGTTPEELAAIYVLSEVCPSDDAFKTGYANLVKQYMPNTQDAVEALNQRAKQKDFKKYLTEARQDAKKAGDAQNQDICKEVTTIK